MSAKEEARVIKALLQQLDTGGPQWLRRRGPLIAFWLLAFIVLFVVFHFWQQLPDTVVVGLVLLQGIAVGALAILRKGATQWHFIAPHVPRESLAARLAQLDAQSKT